MFPGPYIIGCCAHEVRWVVGSRRFTIVRTLLRFLLLPRAFLRLLSEQRRYVVTMSDIPSDPSDRPRRLVPSVQPTPRINLPSLSSLVSGVPSSGIISAPSSLAGGDSSSLLSEPLAAALCPSYAASVSVPPRTKFHTRGLRDLPTTKDQGKVSSTALSCCADDSSAQETGLNVWLVPKNA